MMLEEKYSLPTFFENIFLSIFYGYISSAIGHSSQTLIRIWLHNGSMRTMN
jgi:hypothetical protein